MVSQKRRHTDIAPKDFDRVTIQDAWNRAGHAHDRIDDINLEIDDINKSFSLNDLGNPGYEMHRSEHSTIRSREKMVEEYKMTATKKVISIVVIFILGISANGLINLIIQNMPK